MRESRRLDLLLSTEGSDVIGGVIRDVMPAVATGLTRREGWTNGLAGKRQLSVVECDVNRFGLDGATLHLHQI